MLFIPFLLPFSLCSVTYDSSIKAVYIDDEDTIDYDMISPYPEATTAYIRGIVYSIEKGTFKGLENLTEVHVSGTRATIYADAFADSYVTLFSAQTETLDIERRGFADSGHLKNFGSFGGYLKIYRDGFKNCNFEFVYIKCNSIFADEYAFCDCNILEAEGEMDISEYQNINSRAYECEKEDKSFDSISGGDKDSLTSARTLGDMEIKSVYLGTSSNILLNLNFFVSFMKMLRKTFGHVIPSPDFIHSAIWVGDENPSDDSIGAVFVYGRYFNKKNNQAFLWQDGAKGYVSTFKEFKRKYKATNPMKLNPHKNMKLLDFINQIEANGKWGVRDYNWPTNNCQHFTAKLIKILQATRDSPMKGDWIDLPKAVLNSLESNEKNEY